MIHKNRFTNIRLSISTVLLCIIGCTPQSIDLNPEAIDKIDGISLVASNTALTEKHIGPIIDTNSDYVAIMPFGFIKELKDPRILFNTEQHWFGETKEGIEQYVGALKNKGFKIMLKPQIWVWGGDFTGKIKMLNDENWIILEDSYSKFILEFALLAQELHIELFCIGTELEQFILNRPEYWIGLIEEIKKIYQGKLTYASNWNEFERVPFWKNIDYIGIDAYFPLSNNKTPSVEDCRQGWIEYKSSIKNVSINFGKPILFTEYGYRSVDFTAREPWNSDIIIDNVNLSGQLNSLQALFDEFWDEDWFAGGFIWKWHMDHQNSGGVTDNRYTPQNKPAEDLLKNQYSLYP